LAAARAQEKFYRNSAKFGLPENGRGLGLQRARQKLKTALIFPALNALPNLDHGSQSVSGDEGGVFSLGQESERAQ
jgi:hypothetical protein